MDAFVKGLLKIVDPWCDYTDMQSTNHDALRPSSAAFRGFPPMPNEETLRNILSDWSRSKSAPPSVAGEDPRKSTDEQGPTSAIEALFADIERNFIVPALNAESFTDYWTKNTVGQCRSRIAKLWDEIRAEELFPVEELYLYAQQVLSTLVSNNNARSSNIAKEVHWASREFITAVSIDRTSTVLPICASEQGTMDRRHYQGGIDKVLVSLMSIDSAQFQRSSSASLDKNVLDLLRDGVRDMHLYVTQQLSLRIPSDVEAFAIQSGEFENIKAALVSARESFSMIIFTSIFLAIDVSTDEQYIAIKAEIPLSLEEATRSYQQFNAQWSSRVIRLIFLDAHAPTYVFGRIDRFADNRTISLRNGHEYSLDPDDRRYDGWKEIIDESVATKAPVYVEYNRDGAVRHILEPSKEHVIFVDAPNGVRATVGFEMSPSLYYLYLSNSHYDAMRKLLEETGSSARDVVIDPTTHEILHVE